MFCEITPKRIANQNSEKILIAFTKFLDIVLPILFPFITLLNFISDKIANILKIDLKEQEEIYSEDELKTLVDISHEQGVLETEEKEIIQNALEFGDITLKDIMIPNAKVEYLNINSSYEDVINKFLPQPELNPLKETEDEDDFQIAVINCRECPEMVCREI